MARQHDVSNTATICNGMTCSQWDVKLLKKIDPHTFSSTFSKIMELKHPSPKSPPKTLSKTAFLPPATSLHLRDGGWSAQDKEQDKE